MAERTAMLHVDTFPRRHWFNRRSGRRMENVWYRLVRCPVCGAEKQPLANVSRGKTYYCNEPHTTE